MNSEPLDLNELMLRRREELDELKKLGVNPYPHQFARNENFFFEFLFVLECSS